MSSSRSGRVTILRDFIVDWEAWSRAERWTVIVAAILVAAAFGFGVATI